MGALQTPVRFLLLHILRLLTSFLLPQSDNHVNILFCFLAACRQAFPNAKTWANLAAATKPPDIAVYPGEFNLRKPLLRHES